MFLGLDISTSVLGWSLIDTSGKLVDYGYIDFTPKKLKLETNLFLKMDYFEKVFKPILDKYKDKITFVAIEEAAQKFTAGKSSAHTIFKLASFNFGVARYVHKSLALEPVYVNVTSARSKLGIKVPKALDKTAKKAYVLENIAARHPNLKIEKNKKLNYKKQFFDVSDSIVVASYLYLLKNVSGNLRTAL